MSLRERSSLGSLRRTISDHLDGQMRVRKDLVAGRDVGNPRRNRRGRRADCGHAGEAWNKSVLEGESMATRKMTEVKIVFQDIDENQVFHSSNGTITWKELRKELAEKVVAMLPAIVERGYKRVEIGTLFWFYRRNKTQRLMPLNTMFAARLLKR